ncbi:acyl-CoA dehydrogenase NM domain-like protein [Rozella allomycis CSF55]|uniref:Acyl-CoA dehydrogenase NM domain-like protein n=1 Tax=Rozella allomycis (strain CSF55) TaxID=988480 RepID=A0A075AQK6_ROZAC|nr:Acyl-CoA dehydrogenase/oxidase domain-containing protein [Rozella allomycis CSF55]RKP21917.1 acyl-CoA dehydrogenase NM domain-like protein [Rozella allomycis CSF55]|eukprot:EPZ30990.1 Acyl-CoA dehydrogenase/oxidase domain-containing protein [Rozella allomycis CSF55]
MKSFTLEEVSKHKSANDIWIAINGNVYDVTNWLIDHPGGRAILLKHGGTDASEQFAKFHNPNILNSIGSKFLIGKLGLPQAIDKEVKPKEALSFGDGVAFGDPQWYQGVKSPYYDESHYRLRNCIREFVDKEIMPFAHEWNEQGYLPKDIYLKFGKAGYLACISPIPEKYLKYPMPCGLTLKTFDPFHELVLADELCRCGSGGVVWGLIGGLPPILHFGSEELKQKVIPECVSGEKICCLCITEPYAGSDVANIKTTATLTPDGEHFIVNGEKKWITNGMFADFFTVAVRTGGEGAGGISLLLLERSMPGLTTRKINTSGQWCSGTAYITFENVKVPKSNIIGQINQGFKVIMYNFNHERVGMAIQCVRFSRVCYEEAFKYSLKRKTFGKLLIQHPVIRQKLANMIRQIESLAVWTESIVYQTKTLSKKEQNLLLGGPTALLKAHSSFVFEYCAREAAQIFGGLAFTRGGQAEKVERLYRDVRAYAIPGGSEEIMLDLGAKQAIKMSQLNGAKL